MSKLRSRNCREELMERVGADRSVGNMAYQLILENLESRDPVIAILEALYEADLLRDS